MNRRNDRDEVHDRSTRPTSPWRSKGRRAAHVLGGSRLSGIWHWSRVRFSLAAAMLQRWFHCGGQTLCFRVGSRCVKGSIREMNEDRCYADQRRGLFVVADGMGGHAGGGQASQTVIEVIASRLGELMGRDEVFVPLLAEAVRGAIFAANQELMELARVDVGLSGMGSTAVVGVVCKNQLRVCSVGDSRAYLCRRNELRQLTVDDTLVQGLVSAGALTTGEAAKHPMRHVLIHSVGTRQLEKPLRIESHKLQPGDRLLFTTDGLTDVVGRDELLAVLQKHPDPHEAALALADVAQEAGSRDNITCIVVDLTL